MRTERLQGGLGRWLGSLRRQLAASVAVGLVASGVIGLTAAPAGANSDNKANVTVTVSGTQTYGGSPTYAYTPSASQTEPDPYSVTGTLSCTTTGLSATSAVATYAISSCQGLTLSAPGNEYNQTLIYKMGNVTVTRAPLTVTAPSPTKVYGAAVPTPLTATITGFVNGQGASVLTAQPTCSTTATAASTVHTYPVTCSGGSATNYSF